MFGDLDILLAIKRMAVAFVPLALGIILHEVAHGWVAARRGDPTATREGRITLNPLAHIDPMGLFAFVITSLSGPFVFGWAKPVPVNYAYLRNPMRDMMLISAAGPLTNFCVAFGFALVFKAFLFFFPPLAWHQNAIWTFFSLMLPIGITINCSLGWLNLLPIPPLDGSKIVAGLIPRRHLAGYLNLERYGFVILILLLITGLLSKVLSPLIEGTIGCILLISGLI